MCIAAGLHADSRCRRAGQIGGHDRRRTRDRRRTATASCGQSGWARTPAGGRRSTSAGCRWDRDDPGGGFQRLCASRELASRSALPSECRSRDDFKTWNPLVEICGLCSAHVCHLYRFRRRRNCNFKRLVSKARIWSKHSRVERMYVGGGCFGAFERSSPRSSNCCTRSASLPPTRRRRHSRIRRGQKVSYAEKASPEAAPILFRVNVSSDA